MPVTAQSADGALHEFPDGTDPAVIDKAMKAYISDQQQPTLVDKIVASPVGRALHDTIAEPVANVAKLAARAIDIAPMIMGLPPASLIPTKLPSLPAVVDTVAAAPEKGYQASLAANRNTPGYAAARARADQITPGSSFTDQVTAPFNPALAGIAGGLLGGSWDDANAAADSQSAAQSAYTQAHPILSAVGQAIGGFGVGAPELNVPQAALSSMRQIAPTIAELKKGADAAYKAVDQSGLAINPSAYDQMVAGLKPKMEKLGLDPGLHPDATAAMNRVLALNGSAAPLSFQKVMTMRELAGDAAGAIQARDAMRGGAIKDHIDDFVDNLSPADTVGGADPAQTVDILNGARDLYSRAKQAGVIQDAIDKAGIKASANYSQSGMENALRQQFKSLALNDRAMSRLAPDVQDAVKAVAAGSHVSNVLRAVGKYAPHGPVATMAGLGVGTYLGGAAGAAEGGLASLAVPAIGEIARTGATRLTQQAAQRAFDVAALGKTAVPQLPQKVLQLPKLPPDLSLSQISPIGLFGSGFLNRTNSH